MPRRPDMPCADCGELMWRGTGVLPEGQARCRKCRTLDPQYVHGATRYKAGCRCGACREGKRIEQALYVAMVIERDGVSPTQKCRPSKTGIRRVPGECSHCGTAVNGTTLADPICALCRGNRPGYNIRISRVNRLAVYARDAWTCGICYEPVDPDAPVNSTWDATLDHVIPRSLGGTDDPANLRIAHRWCNSVRGDLRYHADEDLQIA